MSASAKMDIPALRICAIADIATLFNHLVAQGELGRAMNVAMLHRTAAHLPQLTQLMKMLVVPCRLSRVGPTEEMYVEMQEQQEKVSNVPAQQKSINEIIMRVRKLRWAGMDEEAERLVKELERQLPVGVVAESVLPTRLETD